MNAWLLRRNPHRTTKRPRRSGKLARDGGSVFSETRRGMLADLSGVTLSAFSNPDWEGSDHRSVSRRQAVTGGH
jgi:hypothetical protein